MTVPANVAAAITN